MILSASKITRLLVSINAVLLLLYAVSVYVSVNIGSSTSELVADILLRADIDREASVATWFAQSQLLLLAVISGFIAVWQFRINAAYKKYWAVITMLAVYMSVDEGAELHELLTEPMQQLFAIESGYAFFAWIIPVSVIVVIVVAAFFRMWWQLPLAVKWGLAVGAALFVLGAIGMEMIAGEYWERVDFARDWKYKTYVGIEEGLELFGVTISIRAMLRYLRGVSPEDMPQLRIVQ